MINQTDFWLVRPLPRPLKPFPRETMESYLARLGRANGTPSRLVANPSQWLRSRRDPVARLSIVSGQPQQSLLKALPDLAEVPREVAERPRQQTTHACRRCVAQRTGTPGARIWVMKTLHDQVCLRHRLWIGRAVDSPASQVDLSSLPEVVAAQRRHYRLLRQHGSLVMDACYRHTSDLWHSLFQRGYRLSDRAERLRQLSPVTRTVRPFQPQRYVAVYPEIVTAMALYASPQWRTLALTDDEDDFEEFKAEFHRRLPQERALRTTSRAWFRGALKQTARRIEAAVQPRPRDDASDDSAGARPPLGTVAADH